METAAAEKICCCLKFHWMLIRLSSRMSSMLRNAALVKKRAQKIRLLSVGFFEPQRKNQPHKRMNQTSSKLFFVSFYSFRVSSLNQISLSVFYNFTNVHSLWRTWRSWREKKGFCFIPVSVLRPVLVCVLVSLFGGSSAHISINLLLRQMSQRLWGLAVWPQVTLTLELLPFCCQPSDQNVVRNRHLRQERRGDSNKALWRK